MSIKQTEKIRLLTDQGYYGGCFVMGDIGDFFDATNGRVVSNKKFYDQYVIQ